MESKGVVRGQGVTKRKLAAARALRRAPTPEEALIWHEIRGNKRGGIHFRRQQVIDGWIVDFYCNQAGVAIEIDGPIHAQSTEQDRKRDEVLASRGLLILHITNDEVRSNLSAVLERIVGACKARSRAR